VAKTKTTYFPMLPPVETNYNVSQSTRILPRDIYTSGTLPGNTVIRVGEDNIKIDGENRRLLVSDGTNDRILIGYHKDGF